MRTKLVLYSFIIFLLTSFLLSCGDSYDQYTEDLNNNDEETLTEDHNGFQLLETSCFSCHNPDANASAVTAPNMAEVKRVYLAQHESEEDFVDAITSFLSDPSKEKAIMKDAVENFGVMPNMSFGKAMSEAVGRYLYSSTIQDSGWYANSYALEKAKNLKDPSEMSYLDRGFQFAMSTKSVLGKNLKGKINTEGTDGALEFCNLNAFHLTDSMATEFGVKIKRVSDKNRNPNNLANNDELAIIQSFKEQLEKGEEITSTTKEMDNVVIGYYPILTNDMCLQCHGTSKEIKPSTAELIKQKYPNDKGIGYGVNQLRGIWVVEMQK
ncbi:MAG: DUF3365 domain-containing protein [Crocinitomicaceae bacterium]|nr:DUF3365 domain-containing protein [Crocinitomicaceae bacterium]